MSTRWALQKGDGERNISWVLDVYWMSTRWALGEYWQRCLRRCALGEYCTWLEVCTRWALHLDNLCRWLLRWNWRLSHMKSIWNLIFITSHKICFKVRGANMGHVWGRQDPGGSHVGPINFAMWDMLHYMRTKTNLTLVYSLVSYSDWSSIVTSVCFIMH